MHIVANIFISVFRILDYLNREIFLKNSQLIIPLKYLYRIVEQKNAVAVQNHEFYYYYYLV